MQTKEHGTTLRQPAGKHSHSLVDVVRNAMRAMTARFIRPDAYHPEHHYMRGPGPKAHAKDGDHKHD